MIARIEKLNELRIAGLLTDEEFTQQKARVLQHM
ncbi:SHOCT domain-containing protein [Nannocystis pusilla]|uniref:SHOCT domain-containing protein n=1 Tax=Nannocystis pusilla TaxID=889268 RepID=A0A9X3ELQ3_9BACT|nr:SHOCT domain-containing protein [Nannocystis pusilla]